MAVIDIVALSLIFIFALIGLIRGLTKSLFKIFGFIIVLMLASSLCTSASGILIKNFGPQAEESAKEYIMTLDEGASEEEKMFTVDVDWTNNSNTTKALSKIGIPKIVASMASGFLYRTFADFGTAKLCDVLPPLLTGWAMNCIAFLILMLLLSLAMLLLQKLLTTIIDKISVMKTIDRIGGLALGVVMGILVYSVAYFVVVCVPFPFLSSIRETINAQLAESQSTFGLAYALSNSFIIEYLTKILL